MTTTYEGISLSDHRVDEAARVLYLAFTESGYSPSWASAPSRSHWRDAARALLHAVADGSI